ncbi:MAG: MerR family transcriptional regulator [Candidatus Cloacimonetes bacterium]|nr:MerR family transcriptional regulator [Candidatus Cloacimonadota bacterium]
MKKHYYTIGEVSNLLQIKPHIIRYWESEFPQLHPGKTRGGNRKYSQKDIDLLRAIADMLHNQRYTIQGARKKLRDSSRCDEQLGTQVESPKVLLKRKIAKELRNVRDLLRSS